MEICNDTLEMIWSVLPYQVYPWRLPAIGGEVIQESFDM